MDHISACSRVLACAVLVTLSLGLASAASSTFRIAHQADWHAKRGFYVQFECVADGSSACELNKARLALGVADGKIWRFIVADEAWQLDQPYLLRAEMKPDEARLWLNGKEIGVSPGKLEPADCDMHFSSITPWESGPTDYVVFVDCLKLTQGSRSESLMFREESLRHMGLVVFEPQTPRRSTWRLAAGRKVTLEALFRLVKRPDIQSLAPYIDRYGQSRYADWPSKIKSDEDLRKSVSYEDTRLREMGQVTGYDKYGGWLSAGWKEEGTGFYRVVKRNGIWWFVTPEGNPCFYVGLCTVSAVPWESTLITGRESLFEWLPHRTDPYAPGWIKNAMGESDNCDYLSFGVPNMVAKYGPEWKSKAEEVVRRRMSCWGFSGVGKWGEVKGLPVVPVLNRAGVPNVADHPDIFDPEVRARFEQVLRKQIESRLNDPMVVGWSLGNEIHEIIKAKEIEDILAKTAAPPIKRALIDKALEEHGNDLAALCSAWNVTAHSKGGILSLSKEALYDRSLKAPAANVEKMRQFYASRYYEFVHRTVKRIDPNHLYFGFWIVPGWWENEADWRVSAPHCDVIGYDLYTYDHTDKLLMRLAKETDKPIFCGEFSFPAYYKGMRGFGVYPVFAVDDVDSGDKYARWLRQAAQNPYCVGALWFHYRDQPLTGRGPGSGLQLVHGEHYAFGVIDVADWPKWNLVERMRKANTSAAGWRSAAMQAGK